MSFDVGLQELPMQLAAGQWAQWLAQGEPYGVALGENQLVLSHRSGVIELPFDEWDGCIDVKRGIVWGAFDITSSDGKQHWRVNGLPWRYCKPFARQLVDAYRKWAQPKVDQLDEAIPVLISDIDDFTRGDHFLRHSQQQVLVKRLQEKMADLSLSNGLAQAFRPTAFSTISPWLTEETSWLDQTNQRRTKSAMMNQQEWLNCCLNPVMTVEQREALIANQDHNLILSTAGTGKTQLLATRAAYWIHTQQGTADQLLIVVKDAEGQRDMQAYLRQYTLTNMAVITPLMLATLIVEAATEAPSGLSPIIADESARQQWLTKMLVNEWSNKDSAIRWQRHLTHWVIPGMRGDMQMDELSQYPPLLQWLWNHIAALIEKNISKTELSRNIDQQVSESAKARVRSEMALIWPFYQAYIEHMTENDRYDLRTLFAKAGEYVRSEQFDVPWLTIMVDEYQDLSEESMTLLTALCAGENMADKPTLFAVGDSHVSVTGVSGDRSRLTQRFKERFGYSNIGQLSEPRRFNQDIAFIAETFMSHTMPEDERSGIKHGDHGSHLTVLAQPLMEAELASVIEKSGRKASVLILGRKDGDCPDKLVSWQMRWPEANIRFMTCEESQGHEADHVFVLNVNRSLFPLVDKERNLLQFLKGKDDKDLEWQERRLFYIALTRAKEHVWVCAEADKASIFINELLKDPRYEVNNKIKRVSR